MTHTYRISACGHLYCKAAPASSLCSLASLSSRPLHPQLFLRGLTGPMVSRFLQLHSDWPPSHIIGSSSSLCSGESMWETIGKLTLALKSDPQSDSLAKSWFIHSAHASEHLRGARHCVCTEQHRERQRPRPGAGALAAEEAGPRQFTVRVVLTVGRAVNRRSRTRRGNECPLHLQVCKAQISDPPER